MSYAKVGECMWMVFLGFTCMGVRIRVGEGERITVKRHGGEERQCRVSGHVEGNEINRLG